MKPVCLLAFSILPLFLNAQAPTFQEVIRGAVPMEATDVYPTPDGGCILSGYRKADQPSAVPDWYLAKIDSAGKIQWSRVLNSNFVDPAVYNSVRPVSDGGYILTGYTITSGIYRMRMSRMNAASLFTGHQLIAIGGATIGRRVIEVPGGFCFAGIAGTATQTGAVLVNSDPVGSSPTSPTTVQWSRLFIMPGENCSFSSLAVRPDSTLLLTGSAGTLSPDIWLLKTARNGNILWSRRYDSGQGADAATDGQPTPDGGCIVTGRYGAGAADSGRLFLMKTDSQGNISWARSYVLGAYDKAVSVVPAGRAAMPWPAPPGRLQAFLRMPS